MQLSEGNNIAGSQVLQYLWSWELLGTASNARLGEGPRTGAAHTNQQQAAPSYCVGEEVLASRVESARVRA